MILDDLKNQFPDYAYDIKNNLTEVLSKNTESGLTEKEIAAVAIATAMTTNSKKLIQLIEEFSKKVLSETELKGAKTAHALMSMTNVYFRFVHVVDNDEYKRLSSNLQMKAKEHPGIDKKTYELAALGVSAINDCKACVDFHERSLRQLNMDIRGIQSSIRIAAVMNATGELLKFN